MSPMQDCHQCCKGVCWICSGSFGLHGVLSEVEVYIDGPVKCSTLNRQCGVLRSESASNGRASEMFGKVFNGCL